MRKGFSYCVLVVLLATVEAGAESILLRDGISGYTDDNASNWQFMMSTLDAATNNNVTVVTRLDDLGQMLQHDALWLEKQYPDSDNRQLLLTPLEITNIVAFIETGRRVVLRGENEFFEDWDTQLLDLVGGVFAGGGGCTGGSLGGPIE